MLGIYEAGSSDKVVQLPCVLGFEAASGIITPDTTKANAFWLHL